MSKRKGKPPGVLEIPSKKAKKNVGVSVSSASSGCNNKWQSSGSKNEKTKPNVPTGNQGHKTDRFKIEEVGNPVIKSPLDTHGYKIVKLAENGLQGLLVSTCIHPRDKEIDKMKTGTRTNCTFNKISQFNETYVNIPTNVPKTEDKSKGQDNEYKFSKATETQQKQSSSKRGKQVPPPRKIKIKCRRGVHEQDDEMQSFCNNKCICVLYVKAGFHQDPTDVPGMAHFCEHALSLGSKNYPETEAFTKFVETEGGMYNARTEQECTIFYFYVNYQEISHALDMFVDMFANPIFKRSDLPKEIDNINSEFEIKRLLDELRHLALLQSCMKENHPATNFGMGSKDTLASKDIMSKLQNWIKKYYFGENMIFALQGPLSLPELEKLFGEFAIKIPGQGEGALITRQISKHAPLQKRKDKEQSLSDLFDMKKWNKLYHMDIAGTSTFMSISWPLDPKFGKNYVTKPIQYFSYIFSHKGQGSLDWYLKQKGWITSLAVNSPDTNFYCTEYYTIFSISMELTAEGLDQRMYILTTVFSYIKLLQDKKASEEIFNEIRQLQADIFHYRSDMNLSDPTFGRKFDDRNANDTLWTLLHVMSKTESPEELLLSSFLVRKYDPEVLNEFINWLQPGRAMVVFAAKCFEDDATHREKWYQTKYFAEPMSQRFLSDVKRWPSIKELNFPKPNPFISVSFCYPDMDTKGEKLERRDDLLAYDSVKGYLTYGNSKCQKGLLPSAQYTLDFMSPVLEDDLDLVNTPTSDIFASLLRFVLDVELGPALCSLISYELESYSGFIRVILSGPSPKLPQLAKTILNTIENFDEHVNMYQKTIKDFKRVQIDFYKTLMNDLENCANQLLYYVLSQRSHFLSDFICMLEDSLDHDDFLSFVHDFKRKLYISGDLNGCVSRKHASQVAQIVDKIRCKPYRKKLENEAVDRATELPYGERCLLVSAKNKDNRNVVVLNYYQVGVVKNKQLSMLETVSAYLGEAAFEELRTIQSLGYHAEATMHMLGGIYGVTVFVQGVADKHTCGYINERIDDFMETAFKNCLSTHANFKKNIDPWLKEGEVMSYKGTKDFYMKHLLPSGELFRKLSIQIQGYKKSNATPLTPSLLSKKVEKYSSGVKLVRCSDGATCGLSQYSSYLDLCLKGIREENGYFITDVQKFKNDRPCFPNMEYRTKFSDDEE